MKDSLQFRSFWGDSYFQMPVFNAEHVRLFCFFPANLHISGAFCLTKLTDFNEFTVVGCR
jgi:hypothetical protein